jgi:mercuric ion transport protein
MVNRSCAKKGLLALTGVGGLGLLACAVCCALPLIGALGLGAGIAAVVTEEPLIIGVTVALLALGAWGFMRSCVKAAPCSAEEGASCSTSGCGCGANAAGPSATTAR